MAQQPKSRQSKSSNASSQKPKQPGELWEELLGGAGLILVIGVMSFLLYQAWQPSQPPRVITEVEQTMSQENGYLVQIRATNEGDETASSALVEGMLVDAEGNNVESHEITFDYIPPHSQRHGGLRFQANPNDYQLELHFRGYVEP